MTAESDLVKDCVGILMTHGKAALERARAEILESPKSGGMVSTALKYFGRVTLRGALPVFPALVSLSCEAAGGKPDKSIGTGAALLLIAGAADVHDDVMDKSAEKYGKKTVYGKFGADLALLAGDALLVEGLNLLHRECKAFSEEQKRKILVLVNQAFFTISRAEAKETVLKGKVDIEPEKYLEILRLKCVVPQVHCQIGAVIADANNELIYEAGEYGKVFGIISSIVEEFADLVSPDELKNRIKNECPPLPLLYALKNQTVRNKLLQLATSATADETSLKGVADSVIGLEETEDIYRKIKRDSQREIGRLSSLEETVNGKLSTLLSAPIVTLEHSIRKTAAKA